MEYVAARVERTFALVLTLGADVSCSLRWFGLCRVELGVPRQRPEEKASRPLPTNRRTSWLPKGNELALKPMPKSCANQWRIVELNVIWEAPRLVSNR